MVLCAASISIYDMLVRACAKSRTKMSGMAVGQGGAKK